MWMLLILVILLGVLYRWFRYRNNDKKEELSQCTGECDKCGRCH